MKRHSTIRWVSWYTFVSIPLHVSAHAPETKGNHGSPSRFYANAFLIYDVMHRNGTSKTAPLVPQQTGRVGLAAMVDSRHPDAYFIPTKADQRINVTTQAGVTRSVRPGASISR